MLFLLFPLYISEQQQYLMYHKISNFKKIKNVVVLFDSFSREKVTYNILYNLLCIL